MQSSIVSLNNNQNQKLYAKLCTRPTKDQQRIFDALNFKHKPFVRKKRSDLNVKNKMQNTDSQLNINSNFQVGLSFGFTEREF